jgi:hypothetical protein
MAEQLSIDPDWLKAELAKPGRSQSALARFLGVTSAAIVNRMAQGKRDISAKEADKIRAYLAATSPGDAMASRSHIGNTPDLPDVDPMIDYVAVEVLPTHAGLGGGGSGDADPETALMPRSLVSQELRAQPSDLLILNLRGDSMFNPQTGKGFMHGDQVVIDRRDTNPRQPGAFALWFDDGYVLKNVEIIRRTGKLRIFSNNPAYSDDEADPEEVTIMGRPVWLARRL